MTEARRPDLETERLTFTRHTLEDLPDKCSPQSLASVARVLLHSLARLGRDLGRG